MNDVLAFLAIVVPAVALIAISAALLLRAFGPLDLTALWYVPRATTTTWPSGVQEEDPRPWDFTPRTVEAPHDPTGTAREDGPPAPLTAVHPSTHPRSARP